MRNGILSDFISLFFPAYCYACKEQLYKSEEIICLRCEHQLSITNYHLEPQNPVMIKMYGKSPIAFASSYLRFVKSGKTQRLLHQLKYHNRPEIGNLLGKWYARQILETIRIHDIDMIVPVPLHEKKRKKRGYNQSEGFATGLSEILEVETKFGVLVRTLQSSTQTNKSKIERWENVEKIFRVTEPSLIENKHILVVDDVITTGSTLASCANELLDNGASYVSVATIAVAEHK